MFLLLLLLNLLSGFLTSPNNPARPAPSRPAPANPASSNPAPLIPAPSRPTPSQDKTTTTMHRLKKASENTKTPLGDKNTRTASKTKSSTSKILNYLRRILKIQSQQHKQLKSIQLQMGLQTLKNAVTSKAPKNHSMEMNGRDE